MKHTGAFNAIMLIAAVIAASECVLGSVVISQVLYNPLGTESGGEAVELYNAGNSEADISGWHIATEASQADAVMPDNTILCPLCYYLIADSGWNSSRDNMSWPLADYEEALNLYNTDSGVALAFNGTVIDAVGWGKASGISDGLYEGEPSTGADKEGFALLREADTGNNLNDFSEEYPFFRSSSDLGTGTSSHDVEVTVSADEAASITYVNITPDEGEGKNPQVFPIPGGRRSITVSAGVDGEVGNVTASFGSLAKPMLWDGKSYSCAFELGNGLPPGIYNITVTSGASVKSAAFEWMELVSVRLGGSMDFERAGAGETSAGEITVENTGNVPVDIGFSSTDLSGEGSSISSRSIEYSLGGEFFRMSSNTQIRKAGLSPGSSKGIVIRINVPETASGEYTGRIRIIGVGAE